MWPGSAFAGDQGLEQDLWVLPPQLAEPPLVAEQRQQSAIVAPGQHLGGALLALFSDKWRLGQLQREHPEILLESLIAGEG